MAKTGKALKKGKKLAPAKSLMYVGTLRSA